MAHADVELVHSDIGAACVCRPTRSNDCEHCQSSLLTRHGAAIRDLRFGSDLWFLCIIIIIGSIEKYGLIGLDDKTRTWLENRAPGHVRGV